MKKFVYASVVFLMTTVVAPAQNADFYTGAPDGIFKVDLTTGYTEQVLFFPDANVAGYLYDGIVIHAVTATPWMHDAPKHMDCGTKYANWIVNDAGGRPIGGLVIDPVTWQVTQEQPVAAIAGRWAEFFDDCDAPFMYIHCIAGGFEFRGPAPGAHDNPATRVTLSFGGVTYDFGAWPYANTEDEYPLSPGGAESPGFVVYAAVSPIDGTVWCVNGFRGPSLVQFDPVSLTVPIQFQGYGTGSGPIAFDPVGNLWRYDYDGQGNAWLNQIDLTTGNVVQKTANFWAPAESMFFLPR